MTWLIIVMLALMTVLLILLIIKNRKIADIEMEKVTLSAENSRLALQVSTLQNNLEKIKAAQQEIQEIEATKKKTRKKQEAPAAGDSDARLERLNS